MGRSFSTDWRAVQQRLGAIASRRQAHGRPGACGGGCLHGAGGDARAGALALAAVAAGGARRPVSSPISPCLAEPPAGAAGSRRRLGIACLLAAAAGVARRRRRARGAAARPRRRLPGLRPWRSSDCTRWRHRSSAARGRLRGRGPRGRPGAAARGRSRCCSIELSLAGVPPEATPATDPGQSAPGAGGPGARRPRPAARAAAATPAAGPAGRVRLRPAGLVRAAWVPSASRLGRPSASAGEPTSWALAIAALRAAIAGADRRASARACRCHGGGPGRRGAAPGIDQATWRAMQISGLAHILSVSGLHMVLVAGGVLRRLPLAVGAVPAAGAAGAGARRSRPRSRRWPPPSTWSCPAPPCRPSARS